MKIHNVQNSLTFSSTAFGENNNVYWPDNKDVLLSYTTNEDECEATSCKFLVGKLENCLRQAKLELHCSEVLLPSNLTHRIAEDIVRMSEREPCGLRGCVLYINLEEKKLSRRIGKIKCASDAVATFEIFLMLKADCSSWFRIKQLLMARLGRKPAVVISEGYALNKKKLYRSSS
ncbi:DNA damage-inducible transcript 4-like protein [Limulus polyphemus]|uniref:DNA damage-inducible transcript 4-like protein n=1 Tax=Limulus polyphemus TaxID=6850 RepID=A0ABM1BMB1_LIMPO|nr:DNA damage-inducible transcript 4-like protein [Limulus polyphemus]